jgi:uncharacterized protein
MNKVASGSFMGIFFDSVLVLAVAYAQWQLAVAAFHAAKRLRGLQRIAALAAPFFCGGLLLSVLFSFHPFASLAPSFPFGRSRQVRMAAALWIFGASVGYYLYRLHGYVEAKVVGFNPDRRRLLRTATGAAVCAPFGVIGYGTFIGRTNFRVREVEIPIRNLSPDLAGLRIVQLSDIHLSPFLSETELARVVDASNELRPHVAVITGDLISDRGDPLDACLNQLARLRPEAETLGCMGNHEIFAGAIPRAMEHGRRLGIRFLRNQHRSLKFGGGVLNIAGVDYQRISLRARYLEGAERMVERGAVNVLLSHNPDVFPAAARKGYDLTLAGHTHGGQVTVEILQQSLNVARFFTPYVYGLYQLESRGRMRSAYVTRGIGTVAMPVRIGAQPEIALVRLAAA